MLWEADNKSISKFKLELEKLGIEVSAYKVMEAIFRQTIMASKVSGYRYDRDSIDPSLHDKTLTPENRLRRLGKYIDSMHSERMEYGFSLVHINEMDEHALFVNDYQSALKSLKDLFSEHEDKIDSRFASRLIDDVQKQLKTKLSFAGRPTGRYLNQESLSLKTENFDYFSRYLGFAYGIFDPFFQMLVTKGDEEKNNFARFLAAKLNFECENNAHVKMRFKAKMISDRIKRNQKGNDFLAEEPLRLGLLSHDFLRFLCENQGTSLDSKLKLRAS